MNQPCNIRPASPEDFAVIAAVRRRAFPLPLSLLMRFTMTQQALVAETPEGQIAGAVTFKMVTVGGKRIGVAEWAVVNPSHQGNGIGKALLKNLMVRFKAEGCDDIVTTDIDGYNSPSWNTARALDLNYWNLSSQVREFGWRVPKLWWKIPHVAPGGFLLKEVTRNVSESSGLATIIIVTGLLGFFLLPLSRMRETLWDGVDRAKLMAPIAPRALLMGAAIVGVYVAVRMAAHWLAARALNLRLIFRPWDTGLMMASVLAVVFGAFIPAFAGSVYVAQDKFNYGRAKPEMGKIMFAGVAVSLMLFLAFTVWLERSSGPAQPFAAYGRFVGISFGITDTLLFFTPFQAVPAGHLWLWRRSVWVGAIVSFVGLWLVLPILM